MGDNGIYLLNSKYKPDNLEYTLDTIVDERTNNLKLEDYIVYDEAVRKIFSFFNIDIKSIVDVDTFNTMLKEEYIKDVNNNYQRFFSFIIENMSVINILNDYRVKIGKLNNQIILYDKDISELKKSDRNGSNTININLKNKEKECYENIATLKNQIISISKELENNELFVASCHKAIDKLRIILGKLYREKDLFSKPLEACKKEIATAEDVYKLILNNNVVALGLAYNIKATINTLYEKYNELLEERNSCEADIVEKSKEKANLLSKLTTMEKLVHKNKADLNRYKTLLSNNENKLIEISNSINNVNTKVDEIQKLKTEINRIYTEKLKLEQDELEHLHKHCSISPKYKIYDDIIYNTKDILADMSTLFELIDRLGDKFGFKYKAIISKIKSFNFIDSDRSSIKYGEYTDTSNYYFNYKFMNIFGSMKENYMEYESLIKNTTNTILSDNYNINDIIEAIEEMAYSLYNIYFSKDSGYSLYNLGLFSSDVKYNINLIRKADAIMNEVLNYSKKTLMLASTELNNRHSAISPDRLTTLFSEITNIIKGKA